MTVGVDGIVTSRHQRRDSEPCHHDDDCRPLALMAWLRVGLQSHAPPRPLRLVSHHHHDHDSDDLPMHCRHYSTGWSYPGSADGAGGRAAPLLEPAPSYGSRDPSSVYKVGGTLGVDIFLGQDGGNRSGLGIADIAPGADILVIVSTIVSA